MNLPSKFISIITNTFGEEGEALISNLPVLIAEASERWGLADVQPVPMLSYNFVAFAKRPSPLTPFSEEEGDVVLKIGVPRDELTSEIAALNLFHGEGACRLIDADEEKGFLLLERLNPGEMLATLKDDEEATHIAAEVMKKIWRRFDYGATNTPLGSAREKFIKLSDWFEGLKELRTTFKGGTGPLNERIVERAEKSVREFLAENHNPVLMHGDFHHYNILSSERGWLVIDPKGVIGPACYEVGPLLMNPWGTLINRRDLQLITKRRIDILHEHLGFERARIHAWGLAHAVLSTWWSIEENTGWEYGAAFAEMIADLDIK
jgi:streptomycin 6-kinase